MDYKEVSVLLETRNETSEKGLEQESRPIEILVPERHFDSLMNHAQIKVLTIGGQRYTFVENVADTQVGTSGESTPQ